MMNRTCQTPDNFAGRNDAEARAVRFVRANVVPFVAAYAVVMIALAAIVAAEIIARFI